MNWIKYISIGMIGLLLSSCYKDLGNYDYHEINKVLFDGFPTEKQYKFKGVDSLKVYPKISGTLYDDLDRYDFKWEAVVKQGTTAEGKTTYPLDSNTVNLEYFVQLPEQEYSVYLKVKDRETNVTYRQAFDMRVSTALDEGWMILSEQNEGSRLDMISLSGEDEMVVRDIWNGSPLSTWKGPKQLAVYVDMYASASEQPVYFLSEDGTIKLNPADLGYLAENSLEYEFATSYPELKAQRLAGNYTSMWRICVTDQGVFAKNDMTIGALYGMPINKIEGEEDYFEVAPAIGMTPYPYSYNPAVLFYDQTNRRFVQMNTNLAGMRLPTAQETYFPFVTGKEFVYMGGTLNNTTGMIFTILRDNAGLWLYGISCLGIGGETIEQAAGFYYQIDAPEIEKATCFAIHPISYFLFYAVENKIYQYDMVSKKCRQLPIVLDSEERTDLPEREITMLKFNIFIYGDYSKPAGSADMQYRLIVGSKGEGELDGVVRMLDIPTLMDEKPATVYREYSGFGKVVDVTYRERQ